ncbi:GntR family transcriptional regulator [Aquipuribacter sp. MA13-6]|uniref:GntR family transcriptional regulator n=1 Tax=unclassified Aquipuribacter TaxID=2635084 RepID=UPI003EE9D044
MSGDLQLTVDLTDPTPPYEQLRRQLDQAVRHGALPGGHRLPPIRQLARDLGLAVGTVARAYRELEAAGLVSGSRGGGTRVLPAAAGAPADVDVRRRDAVAGLARRYVADGRLTGAPDVDLLDAVRAALTATGATGAAPRP